MSHPQLDLSGKTAVVIGGTSGIGLALNKGLALAGANVVPTGRRAELVRKAADDIRALGRKSLAQTCDVTDEASIEKLLAGVLKEFGSTEILVNCAGRTKRTPTLEVPDAEWNGILDTNLNGTLRACRVFGRHMIERGYGRIVNIASLASFVALMEVAAYCASKAAVAALTKSLAVGWATKGVWVNAIGPGGFCPELNAGLLDGTERGKEFRLRTPMRRFGQLDELAGAGGGFLGGGGGFWSRGVCGGGGGVFCDGRGALRKCKPEE